MVLLLFLYTLCARHHYTCIYNYLSRSNRKVNFLLKLGHVQPTTSACPSGDERVVLFGLLLETNARLSKSLGVELEAACDLPLAWFEVLLQLRRPPRAA